MAWEVVRSKMTPAGTGILENSLNGKMLADVEEEGRPSKWLTYFGHLVLDHFTHLAWHLPARRSRQNGSPFLP